MSSSLAGSSNSSTCSGVGSVSITTGLDPWLIRTIRLLHSTRSEDGDRLQRMYRDVCERDGEAQLSRMTMAEALRDPPPPPSLTGGDQGCADLAEVAIVEQQRVSTEAISNQSSGNTTARPVTPKLRPSDVTAGAAPSTETNSGEPERKKPKITLFNIFDKPQSTGAGNVLPANTTNATTLSKVKKAIIVSAAGSLSPTDQNQQQQQSSQTSSASLLDDLMAELSCCVCHQVRVDLAVNQIVECAACKRLYHQLCHQPPLTGRRGADPGWQCAACSNTARSTVVKR